jgi:preprotein translocase subunit SecD
VARPGPSNRGQLHTGRYLGFLAGLFVILYATVLLAGTNGPLTPKLGLDLQGGAQVILTPKTEGGKKATASQLSTAVEILRLRVNASGVSEAEVVTEGDQIVVQVPGGNQDSIKTVTKAAQLLGRWRLQPAADEPDPQEVADHALTLAFGLGRAEAVGHRQGHAEAVGHRQGHAQDAVAGRHGQQAAALQRTPRHPGAEPQRVPLGQRAP